MKRHTKKWKESDLAELKKLIGKYPVVGIASLTDFPADLFQQLRKKLSGKIVFHVSKQRLIKLALSDSRLKDTKLKDYVNGSCAVVFSEMNPFELFSSLKKSSGKTSARAGSIAPEDIVVPQGDTGLPPGPALSDLKSAGLPVRVQGGTIFIPEDTVVAGKGDVISVAVAATLSKLDIKPIKVSMNLLAAYDGTEVYPKEVLDIDIGQTKADLASAYMNSLTLAVRIAYLSQESVPYILQKAHNSALALAVSAEYPTSEALPYLLQKADAEARALKEKVPEAQAEEAQAEEAQAEGAKAEEAQAEEKKIEA